MNDRNRWLARRTPRPDAGIRLYCFPYAGGSAGDFVRWSERLAGVEVWGVVPPGRGERLGEPPFTQLSALLRTFLAETEPRPPFLFFGHSLGALLAYEATRALQAARRPLPRRLFVSGHRPPHLPQVDAPIHTLPWAWFRSLVDERYPKPPPELVEDPELYTEILETLRADLAVAETYEYVPGPPLSCPITVISGVDDHWTETDLAPWRQHTSAECRIRMIPGDHFYLPERADEAIRVIADSLPAGR